MTTQAKTTKTKKRNIKGFSVDIPFMLSLVFLLGFGLMMVYSTELDASLRLGQEPG